MRMRHKDFHHSALKSKLVDKEKLLTNWWLWGDLSPDPSRSTPLAFAWFRTQGGLERERSKMEKGMKNEMCF